MSETRIILNESLTLKRVQIPWELDALLQSYGAIGFQATGLKKAIDIIEKMVCEA